MYRKLALLFCVSAVSIAVSAQQSVTGKVLDNDNEGVIEGAGVAIVKKADSTVVMGTQTDNRGQFLISKVKDGSYLVRVRDVAHKEIFVPLEVAGKNVIMKNIMMEIKTTDLDVVTVEGIAAQMQVKGDTIEYNPAAFKLAENAVVEDLLKKLPGVTVDNDGKITVNGEEIRRVRVDGKKFFDDDILMATRNLPADIVDKVQVMDLKSDQARMTGFEDDNTERIINLKIKENKRHGVFGNVTVGGGLDKDKEALYSNNAIGNVWLGGLMLSVTGSANNANAARTGRAGGMMAGGGGGGMGGGRTSTENLGINVNAEIGTKADIGGDATFTHSSSDTKSNSERFDYATKGNTRNVSDNDGNSWNRQATMRGEIEWRPDSIRTLVLQPNTSVSWSNSRSGGVTDYYDVLTDSVTKKDIYKHVTNNKQSTFTEGLTKSAGLTLNYNRKSPVKRGRSLTVSANGSFNESDQNQFNNNERTTFRPNDTLKTIVDRKVISPSDSYRMGATLALVEPIFNQNNFLQLRADFNTNISNSEKNQYNKNAVTGEYTDLDSAYSNTSTSTRSTERISLTYQYRETNNRYNYNIGLSVDPFQNYQRADYVIGDPQIVEQNDVNFSPSARLTYNLIPTTGQTNAVTGGRNRSSIEMNYSGRTQQPSPSQMEPGKNNNNLMSETVGNLNLTPSFSHNVSMSYTNYNSEKMSNFMVSLSGNFTQNALVSNSITDDTKKQWRQTVNAKDDVPFSTNGSFTFGAPVFKNRLQFNASTNGNFSQQFSYSDQSGTADPFESDGITLRLAEKGTTNSWGASERITLTFTTDWLEIGANGNFSYTGSKNSLNANKVTETFTTSGNGNIGLTLPYSWIINTTVGYTDRSGYSSFTKNELLWNAVIQKSVFNSLGTISLSINDILQQQQNIRETISDNSRQVSTNNSLTSYFLLSFTYRMSQFGGSGRGGMGGGMGGGRGGMGGFGGGMGGGMRGGGMF